MSAELPVVTARQVARIAERLGFALRHQRGSHAIWVRSSDKARVVIPMHSGDLKRKTLRSIITDPRISVDEFQRML